jgi:hypothetical protein
MASIVTDDMDIYLHIGYMKCASTFLQSRIFKKLEQEGKVNYLGPYVSKEMRTIYKYLCTVDGFTYDEDYVMGLLRDQLKPGKNIISSEGMVGSLFYKAQNNIEIARRLKSLFPEAKVLVMVRNQYDLLISLYSHFIREGASISLHEFCRYRDGDFMPIDHRFSIWDHSMTIDLLNFNNLVDYYASLFGRDQVMVLPMEIIFKHQTYLATQIQQFLELDGAVVIEQSTAVNAGYSAGQLRVARILNRLFVSHHNRYPFLGSFKREYQSHGFFHYHRFVRRLVSLAVIKKITGKLKLKDQALKDSVKHHFEGDNEQLFKEYIPKGVNEIEHRFYK